MGIVFNNIMAIYRRELQSYFASPFAYLIAGVFWLVSGFFFVYILFSPEGLLAQIAMRDQMGITEPPIDVAYQFLNWFLGVLSSLLPFILPILSMGLYTEERKRRTLELLATSPLPNWVVAVGKLLAVVTFFLTLILPLMLYQAIVLGAANPAMPTTALFMGNAGLLLLGAALLSLGMFISSLTDSTILAGILTFALILLLWLLEPIGSSIGGSIGDAIAHLSPIKHFTDLTQGIFNSSGVFVLLSYIFLGIFLTAQSIETFRFQRS